MPKIFCYLSEHLVEDLKKIAGEDEKNQKSLSRVAAEMIELGMKVHEHSQKKEEVPENDPWQVVYQKMCYAQLQSLELIKDIFYCNVDPKQFNCNSHDERISANLEKIRSYMNGLLNKLPNG